MPERVVEARRLSHTKKRVLKKRVPKKREERKETT